MSSGDLLSLKNFFVGLEGVARTCTINYINYRFPPKTLDKVE